MQISDYLDNINNTIRSSFIILACVLGLVWINQQPLGQYWAQHFHRESPWASVSIPAWKKGAMLMHAAQTAKEVFVAQLTGSSLSPETSVAERALPLPTVKPALPPEADIARDAPKDARQLGKWLAQQRRSDALKQEERLLPVLSGPLYDRQGAAFLPAGKKVLYIGDSMMEGVAPRVIKLLKDSHQVEGLNLSKRSTGLAYPGFFNWPETTANALKNNPDIGLLAVFLGANDPWDMPAKKGQPYLRFASAEWQDEYRLRIRRILSLAEEYSIPVIWVLPPNMRKDKLNQGMAVLNTLYETEIAAAGGIAIKVNDLFGYQEGKYAPTAMVNGRVMNVRASDGVHYAPAGEQIIAKAVVEKIHFIPPENEDTESE